MPSTGKQKAKARNSREMDILSDYGNLDKMLGDGNTNSIERELDNVINCLDRHQDFESLRKRGSSSQEKEIRNFDNRNRPVRQDGLAGSIEILSSEMKARLSQEMDSLMNLIAGRISIGPLVQI